MTQLLSNIFLSSLGIRALDQSQAGMDDQLRRQYTQNAATPWIPGQNSDIAQVSDGTISMLQGDQGYTISYHPPSGHLLPSSGGYGHDAWNSDIDMAPHATEPYPSGHGGPLSIPSAAAQSHPHAIEQHQDLGATLNASLPQYVLGAKRMLSKPPEAAAPDQRPSVNRSVTAPERGHRKVKSAGQAAVAVKRETPSDVDEDDDPPPTQDSKSRARKRPRIPHTAVERRYRENLNAHLERLRQKIPSLASKRVTDPEDTNSKPGLIEPAKPSKCEILNGAIERIGEQDREIAALRDEIAALRLKIDDLGRWSYSTMR